MPHEDGTAVLDAALDRAVAGSPRALYDLLARRSGLPGRKVNDAALLQFAETCRARGAAVDRLIVAMATLDADSAPGATALEFIPVCGVTAVGARAAADAAAFLRMLGTLHECADDPRFRVRDAVVAALVRVGEKHGDRVVSELAIWMDGFFHAAAVITALGRSDWVGRVRSPDAVIARLDEGFSLARDAARAASRYPGHKALVEALSSGPAGVALRLGVPVFDQLARWSTVADPALRDVVAKCAADARLAGRFSGEIERVKKALAASAPPRRDPRTDVGPTRRRGRKARSK
jgi:hypothetical protein